MRRFHWLVFALWVGAHLFLRPMIAGADENIIPVQLMIRKDRVLAQLSVEHAFNDAFRRRVSGGLKSQVEIQTTLIDREGSVVGTGRRSCKLLYSLWDETLYVWVQDEGRGEPQVANFSTLPPALKACGYITELPVALAGALTLANGYILYTEVILNPVSEELVQRSRRFVANPRGARSGRSNTVLGAVAGLFSRRGGALGDVVEFSSLPLERPSRTRLDVPQTQPRLPQARGGRP